MAETGFAAVVCREKILRRAFVALAVATFLTLVHLTGYYYHPQTVFAETPSGTVSDRTVLMDSELDNTVHVTSTERAVTALKESYPQTITGDVKTDLTVELDQPVNEISRIGLWVALSFVAGVAGIVMIRNLKNGRNKSASENNYLLTGCLQAVQQRNAPSLPPRIEKKEQRKKPSRNRKWIALYVAVILLWGIVFATTIRSWVVGTEAIVDNQDISFFTLPLLVFNLIFVGATFLIFIGYFGSYRIAVRQQEQAKIRLVERKPFSEIIDLGNGFTSDQRLHVHTEKNEELCSIIIPARDEENVIKNTVMSCLRQSHTNIEVVIVCHNCSDGTYAQARSIEDSRVKAFELNTKEAGKGIASNYGVQMARGKYLLMLDSDGRLNDTFIEDALPLFAAHDYAAVQGRYIPSNRNYNFITRMLSLEGDLWSTPFMTFRAIGTKRTNLGGTGYMIRRDVLLKVGGFANHLVDDYELTFRLLRQKYRIAFAPLCINYDEKPPNLDMMLNQRARWLRGFLSLMKSRGAEPRDLIGNLYWVNPLTAFTGLALLLIAAYSTIHFIAFLYFPFHYSYIPLTTWFALTLATFGIYTAALVMQYGRTGFKYAAWLPFYLPFANYYMIVALKAFFVKSWADTKTTHGFTAENVENSPSTVLEERGT